ncbi:MAG: queuosine precursor transporter [Pseudomonadota bacterium]
MKPAGIRLHQFLVAVAAMAIIIAGSNYLVQFPVHASIGAVNLADLLTFAAFTFPVAFLVTDLTNRLFGAAAARKVVFAGFAIAVLVSIVVASPRIAIASGSAFLISQLMDVSIFDRLRAGQWWRAPLVSSMVGAVIDTFIFFSFAFAASLSFLGAGLDFAVQPAPLLGVMAVEAPRWVSWALGDLVVKVMMALVLLAPYGLLWRRLDEALGRTSAA